MPINEPKLWLIIVLALAAGLIWGTILFPNLHKLLGYLAIWLIGIILISQIGKVRR